MKTTVCISVFAFFIGINSLWATTQTEIAKANKQGKVVFLVVTDAGTSNTSMAVNTAQQAQQLFPKAQVIQMMRSEETNKQLVDKYKLSGAPLPLILVIAPNGILVGGYLHDQATPENLVAVIPTPKKALVLQALNDGKSVFLIISKKSMNTKKTVLSKCEIACSELKDNAKIIEIDFDDKDETKFLNEIKITQINDEPVTYVINNQGQITGSFSGITDSKTLVATVTKKASSGCCPPNSGKSCPPTKSK